MALAADLVIDTSRMGVHALRELIRERIERRREGRLSLMFESFGYKHGIPGDADFVFDVRSLPNPYWEHALRDLTGRDAPVVRIISRGHDSVSVDDRGPRGVSRRRASPSSRRRTAAI